MKNKQKLELTWIGKGEEPKLEPRILIEDPEKSYGDPTSENMLIHGDNLLTLKALQKDFAGKFKCIYIDPPYNTGSAFQYYDDGLEHSEWLNLMRPRVELLKNLLSPDGSLWISIDAHESHYLKVMCDEIFGRSNFVDEVIWQRAYAPINLKKTLSRSHDAILVYAKNSQGFSLNKLPRTSSQNKDYTNPDNDPRGLWKVGNPSVGPAVEKNIYEVTLPSGRKVWPPKGRSWLYTKTRLEEKIADNRIWFGKDGNSIWAPKIFLSEVKDGVTPMTLWTYKEVGHNQEAKKELKALFDTTPFDTPKPERLIQRIIQLGSDEGDYVLDSFLGSGTTAAVAHKLNRKWVGVELLDHAYTVAQPRLIKVIDGEDPGGITQEANWDRGGGFKFFELAPSLLEKDGFGNWVISKEYDSNMLAHAVAKQEGFTYEPSRELFWKQGFSNETDFIFTTTQFVSTEFLESIHQQMGQGETLLITCKAFDPGCKTQYSNITVRKIPQVLLGKCEFGVENYDLDITEEVVNEEAESLFQ